MGGASSLLIEGVLQRRFVHASVLESLVGHFAWIALVSRPALCIPNAVYRGIHKGRGGLVRVAGSLAWELRTAQALLPLLSCDLALPWSASVTLWMARTQVLLACGGSSRSQKWGQPGGGQNDGDMRLSTQ